MYRPQHRDEIYIAKANEVSPADVVIQADRKLSQAFKPRARLLQLLGDQLIGSSKLAVFELVKIAYDADASKVEVKSGDLGTASPWIRVEDNGQGMSLETIRDVWLVPGDDHREKDRHQDRRSPKYARLSLGEKPSTLSPTATRPTAWPSSCRGSPGRKNTAYHQARVKVSAAAARRRSEGGLLDG